MAKSRYSETELVDTAHFGTFPRRVLSMGLKVDDLLQNVRYFEHQFERGERLDHLAAKYFNEDKYWWVIAMVNKIDYPLGITPGTILRIPRDVKDIFKKIFA
jgi:hypothetical protein